MLGIGIGNVGIPSPSGNILLFEQLSSFGDGAVRFIDFGIANIFRPIELFSIQVSTNLKRDRFCFS